MKAGLPGSPVVKTPRFPARSKSVGFQERRLHMLLLHAQLCWTLCDPKDCSLPGSFVHGISQTRILELPVFLLQGKLPNPGMEPMSLASPALAGGFFTTSATLESQDLSYRAAKLKKKKGFLIKDSFFTDLTKREIVIREMFKRIK